MTAGLATLDHLLSHDHQANADKVGERLLTGLRAIADGCPLVGAHAVRDS
ncbi:hypothetical protein ACFYT4_28370 [Streptomyces sp. NPDC004609]